MTTEAAILQGFKQRASAAGLNVMCLGAGNPNATIAIVSEAPGERECKLKMPQVGSGGQFLWDVLRKYGINRTNVWTTNVIKRQLLEADDTKSGINRHELDHWHHLLEWELSQLPNLKYVVVLGNYALQYFIGDTGISKWRGSVLDWNGKKLVISFNPALIIREPKWDIVFRFDMNKLDQVVQGKFTKHDVHVHVNPSPTEAIQWLDRMESETLPVAYDIETIGGETACIGFANTPHDAMCINFRTINSNHYSCDEERRIWRRLGRLFSNPSVKLVAQNNSFDANWLWWKDKLRVRNIWFDTLLAHHTLYPALPHSLAFLTAQYTNFPYYKDELDAWREGGNIDEFWEYNGKDCAITRACQLRMHNELRAQGLEDFFFNHVMQLQPELIRMTQIGVKVDRGLKEQISLELTAELDNKLRDFHEAVHSATGDNEYNPNPASHKQLGELYFRRLKLVGRGTKTDKTNRERMRKHPRTSRAAIQVIDLHDLYAKDAKFLSTYAQMQSDGDGRVRTVYKQYGVARAPGRLSSEEVPWGTGGNLQNIPERAKNMFVADEGYRFVYFDMAQAEARVVGWLANIKSWKEQFERARFDGTFDCHRALCADMFQIPYDDTPKSDWNEDHSPTLRYISKRCRHGLNYRMGPDELARVTQLPMSKAIDAFNRYHRITPELQKWWKSLEDEVRQTKQLWSPMGRRWILLERFDESALESIVAFKPQSCIGDKVASVLYKCAHDSNFPSTSKLLLNVHDANIAICRDNDEDAIATLRVMKKYAEEPIMINGEPLIIPADCAWSVPDDKGVHRWSTLKKIKDPAILEKLAA